MYEWAKGSSYSMTATLYSGNITLNSSAAECFREVRWVMLGLDKVAKKLAIKPVSKKDVDNRSVDLDRLHKISVGKSYAKICNKGIMQEISLLLSRGIDNLKFSAVYSETEEMLVIDLNTVLQKGKNS